MTELLKVGVSFAVEGPAVDDCAFLNAAIDQRYGSLVRFGELGNSRPHVTVALGTVEAEALDLLVAIVAEAVPRLAPFTVRFGRPARETVTGQYVMTDVLAPDAVLAWRVGVREAVSPLIHGLGRTTSDPHLTLAVVQDHYDDVDQLLARSSIRISECRVTTVDVAHAGPKGAKGDLIRRLPLDDA